MVAPMSSTKSEVLADGRHEAGRFDEVQLLLAEREPRTGKVEWRARQRLEFEHFAVEPNRFVGIGDVDRHVMHPLERESRRRHRLDSRPVPKR